MLALLRANRAIRWVFLAQVVSYLGDWFTFVALAGYIDDTTDSEILVSLVLVAFSIPSFLVSPIAGPVVDRFDRRRLLIVVSLAQAASALGFLLLTPDRVWAAFVFMGLISGLAAFVRPAIDAAIPSLAGNDDELKKANSLLGSTWGVMLAVGAAIGGVFSQMFGRRASFVADAITFLIAAALIALVTVPMQRREPGAGRQRVRVIADMRDAVHAARDDRVILALMASKATFAFGAGVVSQLAVLASEVYGQGDAGRGAMIGARGLGSGLGPIIATRVVRSDVRRIITLCGWASIGFALMYLGAAWSTVFPIALVCLVLAHLGGGAQWTLSTYGLQLRTPDAILGRVMAGDFAIVTLVLGLTSLGAGVLSEAFGVQWALTVFCAIAVVAGATYLTATRRLRAAAPPVATGVATGP
jgi:MFS family permease